MSLGFYTFEEGWLTALLSKGTSSTSQNQLGGGQ